MKIYEIKKMPVNIYIYIYIYIIYIIYIYIIYIYIIYIYQYLFISYFSADTLLLVRLIKTIGMCYEMVVYDV